MSEALETFVAYPCNLRELNRIRIGIRPMMAALNRETTDFGNFAAEIQEQWSIASIIASNIRTVLSGQVSSAKISRKCPLFVGIRPDLLGTI